MARLLIVSQLLVAAATSQQVWWQYVKGYCTVQVTRRCNGRAGLLVRMNTAAGSYIRGGEKWREGEERRGDSRNAGRSRRLHTPRPLIGWEAKFAFNSCGSRHYCVRLVDGSRRAAAETIRIASNGDLWCMHHTRTVCTQRKTRNISGSLTQQILPDYLIGSLCVFYY